MSAEYDPENIFAKILDKKVPSYKVYETSVSYAFLDAFPMVEGHTLIIPKLKGFTSFTEMPPAKATEFLRDLQKVAKAVKQATGASAVNIWNNNGEDAGQTVFHPHFHLIPRFKDDKLMTYPPSAKEMLSKEKADPTLAKLAEALAPPPRKLKKAKFGKVSGLKPDSKGLNLKLKILESPKEVETKAGKFFEVLAGDASGTVILSLREGQKDCCTDGAVVALRNAAVKMVAGHIRIAVDKWGKVETSDEPMEEEVTKDTGKNMSATEYELVKN